MTTTSYYYKTLCIVCSWPPVIFISIQSFLNDTESSEKGEKPSWWEKKLLPFIPSLSAFPF